MMASTDIPTPHVSMTIPESAAVGPTETPESPYHTVAMTPSYQHGDGAEISSTPQRNQLQSLESLVLVAPSNHQQSLKIFFEVRDQGPAV